MLITCENCLAQYDSELFLDEEMECVTCPCCQHVEEFKVIPGKISRQRKHEFQRVMEVYNKSSGHVNMSHIYRVLKKQYPDENWTYSKVRDRMRDILENELEKIKCSI